MCISIHTFHIYKRLTPFLLRRKVRLRRNDENLVLTILYQDFTVVCPCVQDSSKFSQISCIAGEPSAPGRQVLVHEDSTFIGTRLQFVALSEDFVFAIFIPILLFGTILLLYLTDLPPYIVIWPIRLFGTRE